MAAAPGRIPIHEVGIAAARRLAALHARCFDVAWNHQEIGGLLKGVGVRAVLAGAPERPAEDRGLALSWAIAGEAEILTLGVVPEARRDGVGQRLLDAIEALSREQGAIRLFLEVAVENRPARALYAGSGFEEIARWRHYYEVADGSRVDAVVMRKDLQIPLTAS